MIYLHEPFQGLLTAAYFKSALYIVALVTLFISVTYGYGKAAEGGRLNNEMIEKCVVQAGGSENQILDCIGHFSGPCRMRPENSHFESQEECLEHEFVLWDQLLRRSLKSLKDIISMDQVRAKVQNSHDLWKAYHEQECRLPYSLLPRGFTAKEFGLNCSIQLTARRVADLIKIQKAMNKFK